MLLNATILNHTSVPVISKAMDAAMLRENAISDNFANVMTPGYQRIEVSFEDQMRQALATEQELQGTRTSSGQMRLGRPEVDQVQAVAYRPEDPTKPGEVNNVDVDIEAAKLAENQIMYNFDVQFIRDRLDTISRAGAASST